MERQIKRAAFHFIETISDIDETEGKKISKEKKICVEILKGNIPDESLTRELILISIPQLFVCYTQFFVNTSIQSRYTKPMREALVGTIDTIGITNTTNLLQCCLEDSPDNVLIEKNEFLDYQINRAILAIKAIESGTATEFAQMCSASECCLCIRIISTFIHLTCHRTQFLKIFNNGYYGYDLTQIRKNILNLIETHLAKFNWMQQDVAIQIALHN